MFGPQANSFKPRLSYLFGPQANSFKPELSFRPNSLHKLPLLSTYRECRGLELIIGALVLFALALVDLLLRVALILLLLAECPPLLAHKSAIGKGLDWMAI
jgi:hypothetical protein